jgi:hypothetical protein
MNTTNAAAPLSLLRERELRRNRGTFMPIH